MIDVVFESFSEISKYFQEHTPRLSMVYDPENSDPSSSELAVNIQTSLEPLEALQKLDEFDENWWLDNVAEVDGAICFRLEYE